MALEGNLTRVCVLIRRMLRVVAGIADTCAACGGGHVAVFRGRV